MTDALDAVERRVCAEIASRDGAMREDLAQHVAIPTGHNHTPGLDEYRGLLMERMRAIGAEIEEIPGEARPHWLSGGSPPEPPISVACRKSGRSAATILIACHIDTVFDPLGSFQTMKISSDGAQAVGPGVVDMKGGVLVALNALEALAESGVDCDWTLLLTSDEETGSYHSDAALRREAARHDVGLVTEPALPGGELAIQRMGSGQFQVRALGRSAHAGRAFAEGVSAVVVMARTIVALSDGVDIARGRILNIGPVQGGTATNVVPDHAIAWGNVRFPNAEIADELARMLEDSQINPDGDPTVLPRVIVRRSFNRPAKPFTPDVERLARLARSCAQTLGQELPFAETGGVCDGNILQHVGLPTIDTLGVRGGGLHTTSEWIELRSLVERAQLFALLMKRLGEGGLAPGPEGDAR